MDNRILMDSFKNVSSVGGDGIIPLNWAASVPKYDPSSFYNWEQDNVPLWVLEQRGDTLYRAMGYPGGNPEGVTFTLSSVGNFDESKAIYDSIEDIVERIPKRLKFPVLVEICTYGNLGNLNLANITCEGEGKLEIKNKTFFQDVNASCVLTADVSGSPADAALGNRQYVKDVNSVYASATMMGVSSTRLARSYADAGLWYSNGRLLTMQGPDTDRQANNITFYVASGDATRSWKSGGVGKFSIPHPYDWRNDWGAGADTLIAGTAASSWGDATPWFGSALKDYMVQKRAEPYTAGQSTFVGYGAWFSSISLKDCQGTIILRDILVDAGNDQNDNTGVQKHRGEYGVDIENTEVILDNVTSMRSAIGGFRATNSRVKVTGHCVGYRNYTKTGKTPATRLQNGVGFYALNSDVEWDPTSYEDSRKYINYFGKSKRGMDLRNSTLRGGIKWNETTTSAVPNGGSQLLGQPRTVNGINYVDMSGAGGDTLTTTINIADNTEHGLYSEGTDIEFAGRFNSYLCVGDGIHLRRSQAALPQFTANHNSGWGVSLEGSQLTYGGGSELFPVRADGYSQVAAGGRILEGSIQTNTFNTGPVVNAGSRQRRIRNRAQFHVDSNNQNLLVNKSSSVAPASINGIPKFLGGWGGSDWVNTVAATPSYNLDTDVKYLPTNHFGATPYRKNNKPGIVVTNNSDAELVALNYAVDSHDTGKGKIAVASNGSNLVFRGTSSTCTTFNYFPVANHEQQFRSWISAGVVATDNSNVELTGPTKSSRFGVPFLAENNSNLKVKPPTFVGTDNILDVSGYTLMPWKAATRQPNHTSLEVHSTRACLVANKSSHIQLFGLGGKVLQSMAGNTVDSVDVLATQYADDYIGAQHDQWDRSTSSGYIKFYPNGFTSGVMTTYADRLSLVPGGGVNETFNTETPYIRIPDTGTSQDYHREGMTGGMCVRAVGDSGVDVNLVNFHFQGSPSSVSGVYYNLKGTGCENFVDTEPAVGAGTDGGTNSWTIEPGDGGLESPGPGPVDGEGDGTGGGTGSNGNANFVSESLGTDSISTNADARNQTNQGTLGTVAGGGTNNSVWGGNTQNDQIGSMTVIGDERAAGAGTGGHHATSENQKYRYRAYMRTKQGDGINPPDGAIMPGVDCMGGQIQIWNIADTSRIHASNILANGMDPLTWSLSAGAPGGGSNCHGPMGKWRNGTALDYYGLAGRRTTYGGCGSVYANTGVFRLMMSTRGDLKSFYDVSTLSGISSGESGWRDTATSGGSPVDQVNGAGYPHWTQNVRVLAPADNIRRITGTDSDFPQGIYQLSSCLRVFGWGMPSMNASAGVATMQPRLGGFSAYNSVSGVLGQPSGAWIYTTAEPAMPIPPLGMDSLGYMRNWLDESAGGMWQNAKHMAEDKVNGLSIYRSHMGGKGGGEGRDHNSEHCSFGVGVRSLNIFDLERLV